jgi:hypothetical protein
MTQMAVRTAGSNGLSEVIAEKNSGGCGHW